MDKAKKILIVSSDQKLKDVLSFCLDGWGYEVFLAAVSKNNIIEITKRLSPDVIVIDVQSANREQLDMCRILKKNFSTAFIPAITLINKRQLRSHLLNLKQGVDDYLIKPPDPLDLRVRIEMALRRCQHSIYASSLTGLPGGKILEDVLNEKLKKGEPFSFGYIDIDNFKYFNDAYGYRKGDGVILHTSRMLLTIFSKFGNSDDFLSHIGGDDFAFITTLDKYEEICHNFLEAFEHAAPFHYSENDRLKGYITTRDRARKVRDVSLMGVSIAVVNREYTSNIKNIIELNERTAELKRYLKTIPESKFMADRRDSKSPNAKMPRIYKKHENFKEYIPLGQLLLARGVITYEQLDEALNIHWRRGMLLGEVLKELGFLDEESLQETLKVQSRRYNPFVIKSGAA
ncbi:MAG: diguanylate cyclase [Candidatus Omnitrophica bacterium]|nr:diguanylate cyclase [Candidatus Omnitrophota bacterium]MDD5429742.1 diguanylate cyclase [Candidatus Omnitrophota bacterium]